MKKKIKLPTILGIILLTIGTFLGVILINKTQVFKLGASGDILPKDIRVSNISDTSLTISWVTDKETSGFVVFNNSPEGQTGTKSFTHTVTISGLAAQKSYQYKINSDGREFDNNGIPWTATTGPTLSNPTTSFLISGSVIKATGEPVGNALVYVNIGGYLVSTITSGTGNFVFQLGNIRSSDLGNYLTVDPSRTLLELFVQANTEDVSSAQVYPQSAKPIPTMILGQTHDFKGLPPSQEGSSPDATITTPSQQQQSSKFTVPGDLNTPPPENVTLDSIDSGEIVTSTKPEFFGTGPGGTTLTITVESENPVTEEVTIPQNGSWNFSLPDNLTGGSHKITIKWIDTSGITRTLTRNFVVQAGELPAFESTPSQSLAPSPSSTTKASTPVASASSTLPPTPSTGNLTPTLLFSMLGVGVMALSFVIWKYANA